MTTPLISTILPTGRVSADKPGSLVWRAVAPGLGGAQTHELYPTRRVLDGVLPHVRPLRARMGLADASYKVSSGNRVGRQIPVARHRSLRRLLLLGVARAHVPAVRVVAGAGDEAVGVELGHGDDRLARLALLGRLGRALQRAAQEDAGDGGGGQQRAGEGGRPGAGPQRRAAAPTGRPEHRLGLGLGEGEGPARLD